jgi:hypothetical protein
MIFIDNKYTKLYFSIIENAKSKISKENTYYEKHHIIPKSLGGSDVAKNIVKLTAREHFICHRLLVKMLSGKEKRSMVFAVWHLTNRYNYCNLSKINSHTYEFLKIEFSKSSSILHKNKTLSQEHKNAISDANTGRAVAEDTRLKISNSKLGKKRNPFTEQHKSNMNKFGIGKNNPNYQKEFSTETKEKMARSAKNRIKYKCHCGKECSPSNYKRWHGGNCKLSES